MLKQRDIQEQQGQQSETSMQTNLLFLFIPLNSKEAIHTIKVIPFNMIKIRCENMIPLTSYFVSNLKSKTL